jgi:hypothetical protein
MKTSHDRFLIALRLLYFATVHFHLLYCPIILSIACKTQLNRLIVLQKKAVRILYGAAYNAMFIAQDSTQDIFVNISAN